MITIFTPTFNRCVKLENLYRSLINQSDRRFVWLIVDDGSVDCTAEQISSWKREGRILIEYIFQQNLGKHVAHNTAVKNTHTEYFYCVDSDDELPQRAIEDIYGEIADIDMRPDIAGLIAKKGYVDGREMCTGLPGNVSEASIRDIYRVYKLKGELALVFKTEVMKKYLFPVFPGEKFVTESVILDAISVRYKMKLLNKIVYLGDYLQDGYTYNLSLVHKKNPVGYHYYLLQVIELARNARELKQAYAHYISGCWKIGYRPQLSSRDALRNLPAAMVLRLKLVLNERLSRSSFFRWLLKRVFKAKFL